MAKCLTLNTHSWMEVNALKKLFDLAEHIFREKYDIICLQEVNQSISSPLAKSSPNYHPIEGTPALHQDNFALQLVHYLNLQGLHYHWTWAYNHIGYSKYHEGVAILSLKPLKPNDILVSAVDDETDYHTRRALVAETTLNDKVVTVVSLHLSWFEKGFAEEWKRLETTLLEVETPLLLMGDFNNPTGNQGYELVLNSPLALKDSHQIANHVFGDYTIMADIDGWEGNKKALKVDHIFTSEDLSISSSQVVFEGGEAPVVSDHYGLEITLNL